jgi:hypothetical protein
MKPMYDYFYITYSNVYTSQYNKALKFGDSVQQQGKNQFTEAAQNLDMQNSSSKQHGTSLAQTLKVRWKARQEIKKKRLSGN